MCNLACLCRILASFRINLATFCRILDTFTINLATSHFHKLQPTYFLLNNACCSSYNKLIACNLACLCCILACFRINLASFCRILATFTINLATSLFHKLQPTYFLLNNACCNSYNKLIAWIGAVPIIFIFSSRSSTSSSTSDNCLPDSGASTAATFSSSSSNKES